MRRNILFFISVLSLSAILFGCQETDENSIEPPEISVIETSRNEESETEITTEKEEIFNGFDINENTVYQLGNNISCLNGDGMIYNDGSKCLYSDNNGNLVMKSEDSKEILIESANAKCINLIDNMIYYINSLDNKAYAYSLSDKTNTAVIADVSMLIVSDKFSVYEDMKNNLYIKDNSGNQLLSENKVLWTVFYGNNIIFTELNNNSCVKAYNMKSKEFVEILDYGFSPAIYGNDLYFQTKDGSINKMNLTNGETSLVNENWGQQFCVLNDMLYYLSSRGICYENESLYDPDDDTHIEALFISNDELYFTESKDDKLTVYRFDTQTKEKEAVQ